MANTGLTGVNWASRPTMQLVADVYNGPGPASTFAASDAWRALSAGLAAADAGFADAMTLARGNWEGPAADAAQAALTPFSEWATTAEAIANSLSADAAFNAESFATTKAAMPSPAEVAAVSAVKDNPVDKVVGLLTGVPTPGEVAESVAAAQQAEAAMAMTGYDASTALVDSYSTLRPPPRLTTGVISAGTMPSHAAAYGDFAGGASQFYAATMWAGAVHYSAGGPDGSAGGGSAGNGSAGNGSAGNGNAGNGNAGNGNAAGGGHGETGGSNAAGGAGGTHAAGAGGSTTGAVGGVGSGGVGSANGGTGAGSHSGGSQSIVAVTGLGAGAGAGATGLGSSRTSSEAFGRSAAGFGSPNSLSGGGAGAGGASSASTGGAPAAGISGSGSSGGGLSGSPGTTAEGSARGPLTASGTSAVGAVGDNVGPRGLGGAGASAATGGRGSGGLGAGAGAGAGRSHRQDDDEHAIPDYLKDLEHFTDGRVVAPPVIGADDTL